MEFFFPDAADDEQAEHFLEATRKFAGDTMGWRLSARRVRRLEYVHDGFEYVAEVGQPETRRALRPDRKRRGSPLPTGSFNPVGEKVVAILEAPGNRCYLVCTANRGFLRGMPIMVGFADVSASEDFTPD